MIKISIKKTETFLALYKSAKNQSTIYNSSLFFKVKNNDVCIYATNSFILLRKKYENISEAVKIDELMYYSISYINLINVMKKAKETKQTHICIEFLNEKIQINDTIYDNNYDKDVIKQKIEEFEELFPSETTNETTTYAVNLLVVIEKILKAFDITYNGIFQNGLKPGVVWTDREDLLIIVMPMKCAHTMMTYSIND